MDYIGMYPVRLILRFNPLFYEMNVLLKYVQHRTVP